MKFKGRIKFTRGKLTEARKQKNEMKEATRRQDKTIAEEKKCERKKSMEMRIMGFCRISKGVRKDGSGDRRQAGDPWGMESTEN